METEDLSGAAPYNDTVARLRMQMLEARDEHGGDYLLRLPPFGKDFRPRPLLP